MLSVFFSSASRTVSNSAGGTESPHTLHSKANPNQLEPDISPTAGFHKEMQHQACHLQPSLPWPYQSNLGKEES